MSKDTCVSVIIAARNAADTLEECLQSVRAQTFPNWKAVVVDDGSTDATLMIARRLSTEDDRISVLAQRALGVSAARNLGIQAAECDWIVFLDADDTIAERHLEALTGAIRSYPQLGAVHCGWSRLRQGEKLFGDEYCSYTGDLFPVLARFPPFIIHSCLVRRRAVIDAGMFDTSLSCCVDWDLWQRVARTGIRFGAVREVLAYYRIVVDSVSSNAWTMLDCGLRVIRTGHSHDPRVLHPMRKHAMGLPKEELFPCEVHMVCWCAASLLIRNEDARPMLDRLPRGTRLPPCATSVAASMLNGLIMRSGGPLSGLLEAWLKVEPLVGLFLLAAEDQLQSKGFASSVESAVVSRILELSPPSHSIQIGATYATRLNAASEIVRVNTPAGVERLHCSVEWKGHRIGSVELPVFDDEVSPYVLHDAIAAQHAWQILGAYFHESLYSKLNLQTENDIVTAWRDKIRVGSWPLSDQDPVARLHEQAGWTVFLQELWGRPHWRSAEFYQAKVAANRETFSAERSSCICIEVGASLPTTMVSRNPAAVITLAGIPLGVLSIDAADPLFHSPGWIAAITKWAGFELCRAAVRELLIGWPDGPASLRQRLEQRCGGSVRGSASVVKAPELLLTPESDRAIAEAIPSGSSCWITGRRSFTTIGNSSSRRAVMSGAASGDIAELARKNGEPVARAGPEANSPRGAVYSPELLPSEVTTLSEEVPTRTPTSPVAVDSLRLDFEALFAQGEDPWGYTNEYERVKYEQTASLLAGLEIEHALELACAEGHFTVRLAPLVRRLLATDVSGIALARARRRCAAMKNISFERLDLTSDPLPGPLDLIVCSEVLYYVVDRQSLVRIAQKITKALADGGYFLTAHANLVADEPDRPGRNWNLPFGAKTIGEVFSATQDLQLIKQVLTPLYRIQLFQRRTYHSPGLVTLTAEMGALPPKVGASVKWKGGRPIDDRPQRGTERLPILMYHRIAPIGEGTRHRYCVDRDEFEEQMRFLHDCGGYTISLNQWHAAQRKRQSFPGKAFILTFDDGYRDFREYALPVLKRYNFSAHVFVVTAKVGGTSDWGDDSFPLLGWDEIRELFQDGVEFGSHTHTHRSLLTLSIDELASECAQSRLILERELGCRVTSISYPYGETDRIAQHLVGACGYELGVGIRFGLSSFSDNFLDLARVEITGHDEFEDFAGKLWAGTV